MIPPEFYRIQNVTALTGEALYKARLALIDSLSECTRINFSLVEDDCLEDIWRTGIKGAVGTSALGVEWHGFIGASDHLNDGTLEYCAYLFPVMDGHRLAAYEGSSEHCAADYVFRYFSMCCEADWVDEGWKSDVYEEFTGWYSKNDPAKIQQSVPEDPSH